VSWELTDQYMFGADIMVAPVLNPVGSDSSSRANSAARNGGSHSALPVASVKVYIPAKSVWVHLWTGQLVEAGVEGRYVAVDAPMGYPPVFYLPTSAVGQTLRTFVLTNGYAAAFSSSNALVHDIVPPTLDSSKSVIAEVSDSGTSVMPIRRKNKYTSGAVIAEIRDYVAPDWTEWLGISQYVSKWDSTYYSIPSVTGGEASVVPPSATELDSVSIFPVTTQGFLDTQSAGAALDIGTVSAAAGAVNSLMYQDIDVDLSSLFYSAS
jgi:hypothetical protein